MSQLLGGTHINLHYINIITMGCGLGLETHQRLVSRKIVNVSVSAIYVSCPRPIFGQIVQATVRSVNGL